MRITYLKDSTKTEKGWKYYYRDLDRTILSSVEEKSFVFNSTMANKIRIIIDNGDNTPLTLNDFVVEGYSHELVARFTSPATYYLTYGNEITYAPRYDIASFLDKIPTDVSEVSLGDELVIEKDENKTNPLFQNKLWMWAIMILIIVVMGWFTIKMLEKK